MMEVVAKIWLWVERITRQVAEFFYFQNFKKKHISIGWVNGSLSIASVNHEDMVAGIREKIEKLKGVKKREEFIGLALGLALEGCNFIIFSLPGNKDIFVQFWTGRDRLDFDFCGNRINGLRKHYLALVGLLSEFGYVDRRIDKYQGKKKFKTVKTKSFRSVDVNFGRNVEEAARFTELVFRKIYKVKGKKLEIELG